MASVPPDQLSPGWLPSGLGAGDYVLQQPAKPGVLVLLPIETKAA